jgi:hypothetical protein
MMVSLGSSGCRTETLPPERTDAGVAVSAPLPTAPAPAASEAAPRASELEAQLARLTGLTAAVEAAARACMPDGPPLASSPLAGTALDGDPRVLEAVAMCGEPSDGRTRELYAAPSLRGGRALGAPSPERAALTTPDGKRVSLHCPSAWVDEDDVGDLFLVPRPGARAQAALVVSVRLGSPCESALSRRARMGRRALLEQTSARVRPWLDELALLGDAGCGASSRPARCPAAGSRAAADPALLEAIVTCYPDGPVAAGDALPALRGRSVPPAGDGARWSTLRLGSLGTLGLRAPSRWGPGTLELEFERRSPRGVLTTWTLAVQAEAGPAVRR